MQNAICKLVHKLPQRKWFIKVVIKPLKACFLLNLSGTTREVEFEHFSCLTKAKIKNNLRQRKIALDRVQQARKTSFRTITISVETLQKGMDIELNSTETQGQRIFRN